MKVKFLPQNLECEIKPGQTIMSCAHENGVVIRSACNGMPQCAECRIKIVDGEWNINPPSRKELNLIGTGYYIDQRRLSCQVQCFGDVTVDTSEQIEKSSEGPVTKKFLTKVHKSSAQESFSLGGVLIEQDNQLLAEIQKDVADHPQPNASHAATSLRDDRPRQNQPAPVGSGSGGGSGGSASAKEGGGANNANNREGRARGGGRNRRRRGGRKN